jgi:hypothetical protein
MPKIYTVLSKARALSSAIEKKWRKTPKSKFTSMLLERPPTFNLQKESAAKIARRIESKSHISLTNKIESAFNKTLQKPGKSNQRAKLIAQKNRALNKAFTLSLKRGQRAGEKTMTKFGYEKGSFSTNIKDRNKTYYKRTKRGLPEGMTTREMGWAPEDPLSAEQKAFYIKGKPMSKVKRYRKTLSKIYESPKSWKQRSHLKSLYRAKAKSEIGLAKLERSVFRDTTIQKQTGITKKNKPIWKTIWKQPKKEFKKW